MDLHINKYFSNLYGYNRDNYGLNKEAELLYSFLEKDEMLIFGFKRYKLDLTNLDNILDKTFKELIEYGIKKGTIDLQMSYSNDKWDKFYDERTIFTNNKCLVEGYMPFLKNEPLTTWIRPNNMEETKMVLENEQIGREFMCVILKQNEPFEKYRLGINCMKEEIDFSLYFIDKKEEFLESTLLKLKLHFGDMKIVIEEYIEDK